jgi:L-seryl-tRNA(Ser) seleniumtransferase
MRALRADKMTYATLEATLQEYAAGRAPQTVPVVRMMRLSEEAIETRAKAIVALLPPAMLDVSLVRGSSTIGGGSAPGSSLPTCLIAISHRTVSAVDLESRLRQSMPPVVARIENDQVLLDLRTVLPQQDPLVVSALSALVPE